jgi:uncharacterized protein
MAEFSLEVNDLDEIGKDFSYPVTASWLARELDGCPGVRAPVASTADGVLEVHAQKSGTDFLVRGHVTATVVADCYRCLEDVSCTVTAELTALYAPAPAAKVAAKHAKAAAKAVDEADDDLPEPGEVDQELFSGDKLVLDSLVREHVILEVPMQPLCREDCPGIPVPEHIRGPANFGEEESKGGALRAALSKLELKK